MKTYNSLRMPDWTEATADEYWMLTRLAQEIDCVMPTQSLIADQCALLDNWGSASLIARRVSMTLSRLERSKHVMTDAVSTRLVATGWDVTPPEVEDKPDAAESGSQEYGEDEDQDTELEASGSRRAR